MPQYDIEENDYKKFLIFRIKDIFREKYRIISFIDTTYFSEDTSVHVLKRIQSFLESDENVTILESDDPNDNYIYGWCSTNIGSFNNAARYYEKAANAGNVNAMFATAKCYNTLNMYDDAEKYYLKAIDHGKSYIYSYHISSFYSMHKSNALAKKYAFDGLEKHIIELNEQNNRPDNNTIVIHPNIPTVTPSPARPFLRNGMDREDYAKFCDIALKHNYPSILNDVRFADEERNFINFFNILDNIFTNETINILSTKTDEEISMFPKIYKVVYNLLKTSLEPIKLHFEYSIHGKGYQDAERDFINIVNDKSKQDIN